MKSYLYLLLTFLSAFLVLLLVFHFGDIPNRQDNGFKRVYLSHAWSAAQEIKVQDTLYEIAGVTPWNIYTVIATEGEILETGRGLPHKIRRIPIPFFRKFYDSLQFGSLSVRVDSPYIYLFAENKPAVIKTRFDASVFEVRILPPGSITREVMTDVNSFIFRKLEPAIRDQVFVRYDFLTGQLKRETYISPVYGDGGIVTDGQLHFDAATNRLYYVYYYRNLLLSFDTSLNSVHTFSLIDTTRSFTMRTGLVTNAGLAAYTNITPDHIINKVNFVEGGRLYNMSGLKADNDPSAFFSDNSILDITDLRNGSYLGSIYFPAVNGNKLSRFVISDNRLIALYTNSIMIYDLHLLP